jgi:anti-sigma regulatory factor (Ser/Thr protein kinase)
VSDGQGCSSTPRGETGFRHEAFFYDGEASFLSGTLDFIRSGLAAEEAVFVVVSDPKIRMLRAHLGGHSASVTFADMHAVGRNPATIIPAWQDFVERCAHDGVGFRGIGEPVWPGRTLNELAECERHEALLNVAFADGPAWSLLCPYDTKALSLDAIDIAHLTHPIIGDGCGTRANDHYAGLHDASRMDDPLTPAPEWASAFTFDLTMLRGTRALVSRYAADVGVAADKIRDLTLVISELATNSVMHSGTGRGTLRLWREHDSLIFEIADNGHVHDPLVGRRRPRLSQPGGRGLWLANHLCDLVQIRSGGDGTVVRVHVALNDDCEPSLR